MNKADRDGADATARELRHMIDLGSWAGWTPPVLKAVAAQGTGIDEVVDAIRAHQAWLAESGQARQRRLRRIRDEIIALVIGAARERLEIRRQELEALSVDVLEGRTDPFEAAARLE